MVRKQNFLQNNAFLLFQSKFHVWELEFPSKILTLSSPWRCASESIFDVTLPLAKASNWKLNRFSDIFFHTTKPNNTPHNKTNNFNDTKYGNLTYVTTRFIKRSKENVSSLIVFGFGKFSWWIRTTKTVDDLLSHCSALLLVPVSLTRFRSNLIIWISPLVFRVCSVYVNTALGVIRANREELAGYVNKSARLI